MAKRSKKKKKTASAISKKIPATEGVAPWPPSWFTRDWLWGLILVLAIFATYQPVWYAGFVWDDDIYVTANPVIIGPLGLKEIWTTSAANICPWVMTTFWVEHALWGLAPLPYHLVNVLMHGACAIVLWRVLRSLHVPGAWLGAALWALHPVEVESVAWITEMKNTESGLFFLLSILFFVRWLRDLDQRNGGGWNYALTLLCAALAMASKTSTVILPVVLGLCAWWIEGRWQWRNLARLAPVFLMSLCPVVLTMWVVKVQAIHPDPQWARSWPERLVTAGDAVWFYLGKLLWPHPLITIYPRWEIDAGQWISYLPLLAVMIVLFVLWFKRDSWSRPWFFVFAYFVAALLPVLGLVDIVTLRYSWVFDHYQYLASMGPLALIGAGMVRFSDFALSGRTWLPSALCAGLLLVLGMTSWQRAWVYENQETLWRDTLAQNPTNRAGPYNLGVALAQNGRMDEAIVQFQKTVEIDPNYAEAHNNLGNALLEKGRVDEAIIQYQKALEINPGFAESHSNLGAALLQKGQVDEAIAQYQKALEINPDYVEAHNNLGLAFLQKGQADEAIGQFQDILRLKPDDSDAQSNLADAQAMAQKKAAQKGSARQETTR